MLLLLVAFAGAAFWVVTRPAGSGVTTGSTVTEAETEHAKDAATPKTKEAAPLADAALRAQTEPDGQRLIEKICGTNAYTRLRELSSSGTLTRSECETLYAFLRTRTEDENLARMAAIRNSVMNILRHQPNLPDSWVALLRGILEDEDQHDVIRDYALQHLFACYRESLEDNHAGMSLDDAGRHELRSIFWDMVNEGDASFTGTALLGLQRLSSLDPDVDSGRLASESLAVLEASHANPLVQITAFQVSALQGDKRAVPRAVEAARNGNLIPLRVSAIAALGTLGGADDAVLLKGLLDDLNPSIVTAAGEALQRLEMKTEG
jgi:hypothetical protein